MNLTNNTAGERQRLQDIAVELRKKGIHPIANNKGENNSYYEDISAGQREYIREYSFESIAELKQELLQFWKNESSMHEFIPVILASAFKNQPEALHNREEIPLRNNREEEGEGVLPNYTYTF